MELNDQAHTVRVGFSAATEFDFQARLRITQPVKLPGVGIFHPTGQFAVERDAFVIPLKSNSITWIELTDKFPETAPK